MAIRFSICKQGTCALSLLRASELKISSALPATQISNVAQFVKTFRISPTQVRYLTTKKEIQESLDKYQEGKFDTIPDPSHLEHFIKGRTKPVVEVDKEIEPFQQGPQGIQGVQDGKAVELFQQDPQGVQDEPPMGMYTLPHPIWSEEQLYSVRITHKPPEGLVDKMAYHCVQTLRGGFDIFSGFKIGQRNEHKWLKRIIFLETVAGVPGMVAAMMRHMISLRRLQRDYGWIHTLLEEAENERMHLMTALQLKDPSWLFRTAVIGSQGVFVTLFSLWYIISPRFCHRFVGYLEEEAVKTYTKCLEDIDFGPMKHWRTQKAPDVAIRYWKLPEDAVMRDVILAIRADEAHHRVVNHTLASMRSDQFNPYKPGQ